MTLAQRIRRAICRIFGHAWVEGGTCALLEFPVCVRCGKWERWAR